jgi:ribosomal protein S18 acetylase RimI-like enzyme
VSAPPPLIRPAEARDFERVLALWAVARSRHARTPDTPEALERLAKRDPEALLVAELGGEDDIAVAAWERSGYARDPYVARYVKDL